IWKGLHDPAEIGSVTSIGTLFAEAGKIGVALAKFNEALQLADRYGDSEQKSVAMMQMGNALRRVSPVRAQQLYRQALAIQQQRGDLDDLAATLNGIGLLLINNRHYQDALGPFQRALRIYVRKGSPLDQARTLTNLGWT